MSRRNPAVRSLLPLLSLVILAAATAVAWAGEPAATDGAAATSAKSATTAAPALPEPTKELSLVRRVSPEDLALKQILAEGQAKTDDLLSQAQGDPARLELVRGEIVKIKADTDVRYLQAKLAFARARGDAQEIATLERALAPKLTSGAPAPVARAEKQAPEAGK